VSRAAKCASALFVAAVSLRVAHLLTTRDAACFLLRVGDEDYYHLWAHRIARGELLSGEAFFTSPLYAYVLASLYRVTDSVAAVRALNVVFGSASLLLTALAARAVAGPAAGLAALAVAGFSFGPLFHELFAEKTSLVMCLTSLATCQVAAAPRRGSTGAWTAAGLACGVAALAHPLLLVVPAAALLSLAAGPPDARPRFRSAVALAAGTVLGVAPATVHNAIASRDFVPICSNGGHTFYVANHEGNPDGRYWGPPFLSSSSIEKENADFRGEAERALGRALKPSEVSAYFVHLAAVRMLDAPGPAARRLWNRLRWTFNDAEGPDSRGAAFHRGFAPVLRLPLLGFGPIAFLGLAGLAAGWRERRLRFVCLFFGLFALANTLLLVNGRYRLPLLVPGAILGGAAVDALLRMRRPGPLRLAAGGAAAAALLWFVMTPVLPGESDAFYSDRHDMGVAFVRSGRDDLAAAEFAAALDLAPGFVPSAAMLAGVYSRTGDHARAVAVFEGSILPRTQSLPVLKGYGEALAAAGRPGDAVRVLEAALAVAPADDSLRRSLLRLQTSGVVAAAPAGTCAAAPDPTTRSGTPREDEPNRR